MKTRTAMNFSLGLLLLSSMSAWAGGPPHQNPSHGHNVPQYNLPPHHQPGHVFKNFPKAALSIHFGKTSFFYLDGAFYRPHGNAFIVVSPPIGAIVPILPPGYVTVVLGGRNYYTYEGIYYEWIPTYNGYKVIEPMQSGVMMESEESVPKASPDSKYKLGDMLKALPEGASSVTIKGAQYFKWGSDIFLPSYIKGEIVYIVVNPL